MDQIFFGLFGYWKNNFLDMDFKKTEPFYWSIKK